MPSDFDDIRAALEHQLALYGDLVLVDDDVPAAAEPAPVDPKPTPEPIDEPDSVSEPDSDPWARIAALIPADSPLRDMTSLDEVAAWVATTELIELDRTRKNPVFGVGNPEADLLVIGEAPGADEDEQGEPFVGRAGKLLTDILDAIGFERSDVYIANILKSRPPNNRDPFPDEVAAHIPILHKQITLIRPKLILCVGRTSGTSLLGRDSSLKDMRGVFHDYHGIEVMVTYHPAALLRNPNWKRPTWEDVQLLRRRYDELTA
ncbi:MAG: uracil-DNA glycosylase [Bacteroidetes bacterium]|nr:uracil-DNA glycosylase [Bacteroidota bacterium]